MCLHSVASEFGKQAFRIEDPGRVQRVFEAAGNSHKEFAQWMKHGNIGKIGLMPEPRGMSAKVSGPLTRFGRFPGGRQPALTAVRSIGRGSCRERVGQ